MKDININEEWQELLEKTTAIFGKKPDLNALLFIIGVQEVGIGVQNYSKEQKQDLMHVAICKLLSQKGYFELTHIDQEGWPHYTAAKQMPAMTINEQEYVLKDCMIDYFRHIL